MDHFNYKGGILHAEDVPIPTIAEAVGSPFFCYSTATLTRHYQVLDDALSGLDHDICYAVKANSNQAVIATLAALGAGADVVSGGELTRVLDVGIPPEKIVFSGVGKTREEMTQALNMGIFQINVESEAELEILSDVATGLGKTAPVAIRVNPDVDAKTHEKITTGKSENKFGIDWVRTKDVYDRARALPGIEAVGITVHIGSQLTDLAPYRHAYARVRELVEMLRAEGHNIRRIDLGGGLGIPYGEPGETQPPSPADYGHMVREVFDGFDAHITVEPGRMIAGNAGIFVTRVIYVKAGEAKTFAIIDGAMNDLIRPTLYEAYHTIVPVVEAAPETLSIQMDVVGPVCESGDYLAKNRSLPPLDEGDFLAVRSCGAYGAVMSSVYNSRPLTAEVMVNGDQFEVVREPIGIEDLLKFERCPSWLDTPSEVVKTGT